MMGGPAVPQGKIDITELIDAQRAGGFLFGLAGLCALILAADGFDTQAIGYVAPAVIREWGVEKSALGPVFSAGLFGLLIGSLVAGPLADMIGRRPVLIAATIWFGTGTLLTSLAGSLDEMLWLRFLTGLGLGGALPNCVALVSEYAPKRRRAMLITTMFCGFSIGAALGGVLASEILPQFGWRAVFYVGGTIPLALAPLIFWRLPESLRVLVARGHFERAETVLARMGLPARELALPAEDRGGGLPLKRLFSEGRAAPTLFLWVAFFMNLLSLYFMTNWLPVISHEAGLAVGEAIMVTAMFQAGGTVGGIAIGWLADKIKPQWVLAGTFFGAAFLIAAMGRSESYTALAVLSFGAGFCVVGSQIGANALAGIFYPPSIRSTGVGWALGVGRFGAVAGPLIGGFLLAAKMPIGTLFFASAAPSLCAAFAIVAMGLAWKQPASAVSPQSSVAERAVDRTSPV
jgi:MFS transporter, AAHS family, 4-hydroxybenzoate transporter